MAWDKKRGGHYCDRCDAVIWMDVRQERFIKPDPRAGTRAGDPYVSVSRVSFHEPEKPLYSGFMYCYDCEGDLFRLLEEFNKRERP